MPWPMSQDYNEAIQSPDLCFSDAELRQAEAVANAIGIPRPYSGNFADVYEMHSPGAARKWAVKCFTRQVPGLRERYAAISAYLKQVNLPFMVDFTYLDPGIKVRGLWYPVLKMHWVEGFSLLNGFVRDHADDPPTLELLCQLWLRLARRLRDAQLAHCDLQHGNVLLVPGVKANSLAVRLIDYDGMFVPALAARKSGEVGHPAFQHPQRLREGTYSLEVDRFPHLVIYTALRALMVGSRYLWNKYDNGDNLLFRQRDLEAPGQSPVFQELTKLNDPELRRLVQVLAQASQRPLEQAPLLDELVNGSQAVPTPRRMPAAVPVAAEEDPAPGAIFAQAMQTEGSSRRRRSSQRSYVGVIAVGVLALAGLMVGGIMLANRKPKDTGPKVAVVGSQPMTTNKTPDTTPEPPKPEPPKPEPPKPEPPKPEPPKPEPPKPDPTDRKTITNQIGMKLVPIKAGKFMMGSPTNESGRSNGEEQHEVEITRPFYMGMYTVTVGQFRQFVQAAGYSWKKPGKEQTDEHPVVYVTWNDAVAFCDWLSKKDGQNYRLPTEAEWEYACRAGSQTKFSFGDDESKLADYAWYSSNSGSKTQPVGQKKPNVWGLYDMHGNVWQWCADWYDSNYYKSRPKQDPPGPSAGASRVFRGGSCYRDAWNCRSACRFNGTPSTRSVDIGFRVVCVR